MRIISVTDDIFKFAPKLCDTAAFWPGGHPEHCWEEFFGRCESFLASTTATRATGIGGEWTTAMILRWGERASIS